MWDNIKDITEKLAEPFFLVEDLHSLYGYAAAIVFVLLSALILRVRQKRRPFALRAVFKLIFDKRIWTHRSTFTDLKLYILYLPFVVFFLGFMVLTPVMISDQVTAGLTALFGPPPETLTTHWGVIALIAVTQILAIDFGYWAVHYAMHKNPVLWEFHKVHHSAEVLTPLAEYRQHPVEMILFPSTIAVTAGTAYAVITHIFGKGSPELGMTAVSVFLILHLMSFGHLRHAHINIRFTGIFGYLLHSPAHHHIHHSDNPEHFDRNMGFILSLWDWMAGTLHLPEKNQKLTLGIGEETRTHDGVLNIMWLPCRNAYRLISAGWVRPPPETVNPE